MSASFQEVYRLSLQLSEEDRRRLADYLVNPPPPLTEHFGLSSPLHLTPDGSHVVLSGFLALTGENEIWVIDLP